VLFTSKVRHRQGGYIDLSSDQQGDITPRTQVGHPHKPHPAEPKKTRIKRESQFQRIDHRTRPISCDGSNQREPPVLPNSPSPRASADTLFCQPHVRLRSSVNPAAAIVGGKWGESRVLAALGNISRPDRPSGACGASPMMYRYIGSDFSPFLHCIIA
jgi:hypothetical protein